MSRRVRLHTDSSHRLEELDPHVPARSIAMIDRLLLLGATGDLSGRFLLPPLRSCTPRQRSRTRFGRGHRAEAMERRRLSTSCGGTTRRACEGCPGGGPRAAAQKSPLLPRRTGRARCSRAVRRVLDGSSERARDSLPPIAVYLALPPRLFVPAVKELAKSACLTAAASLSKNHSVRISKVPGS
jgi:glucose-6-phosphate 1-dehydrogenase